MFAADTLLTVKTVLAVVSAMLLLLSLQLPVLPVRQLALPPGLKLPLTVALATAATVLVLYMLTVALAVQFLRVLDAEPLIDCTAIVALAGSVGAPGANE